MRPSPRVRCGGCAFEWFGETAAHGLRIVGSCPKCGGTLDFLVADEAERPAAAAERLHGLNPAAVLGTPTSWAR
jgi:hypothetical protein